ncbi:hypothetical protein RJT34_13478 [Clitoria ternatea]|uniref:Uncharacterized protein n=1 Tax=Clitoria ternatea TaxID=43366 RepID=A0AAN9PLH2_CLITE
MLFAQLLFMPAGRSGRSRASRPAPKPVNHAPVPAPAKSGNSGSLLGGIGSTITEGMAFGTGSSMAHRAANGVMGPPLTIHHETVVAGPPATTASAPTTNSLGDDACNVHSKAFHEVYFRQSQYQARNL